MTTEPRCPTCGGTVQRQNGKLVAIPAYPVHWFPEANASPTSATGFFDPPASAPVEASNANNTATGSPYKRKASAQPEGAFSEQLAAESMLRRVKEVEAERGRYRLALERIDALSHKQTKYPCQICTILKEVGLGGSLEERRNG